MGYCDILAKFLGMFPQFMEQTRFWRPGADRNTISVELVDGQQYVFTYWNDNEWDLTAVNPAVRRV